ncbi:MAG TPA: hypothetical protein PL129_07890 [bacterium]|nr:hypothetical protein [bacterium]
MLRMTLTVSCVLILIGCDEDKTSSEKEIFHRSLNDRAVKYLSPQTVDLDSNGAEDYSFTTSLMQEDGKTVLQFVINGTTSNAVLYNTSSAEIPALAQNTLISSSPASPKQWDAFENDLCSILYTSATDSVWRGNWSKANHQFVGVRFTVSDQHHYGWISMSADTTNGQLILHACAFNTTAGGSIKAGEK